ncbi:MAG: 2-oxoacid:ferredoxin oxidoreductase subunit beta [Proteobacteria bacterium]|nr:MAG: 2-oxoacid:ferredoxin oxidoreductase subunit beta [Pseudomonadota bacterium]QKK10626.1 MAG: 2-oxoacid:ferredoxin oxidoreductase subunit beta [Pseudomonadota bacterium]
MTAVTLDKPAPKAKSARAEFKSDQEVRWCPGCGDYSILNQFIRVLADLDTPRENHVLVSGIGCSSRFPYYVDCYGIHSIHGRAPTIATGIKALRPELTVWVVTGDGDGLSIGGNHLLHALRRNVDIKVLLFNNRVYGLTKGQYSPTSLAGMRTKTSPGGSIETPLDPLRLALTAGASFVARSIDTDGPHLYQTLKRAAEHKGAAFVEIFQNCPVFNDEVHGHLTNKTGKAENVLYLEAGKPLVYGAEGDKGIAIDARLHPEVVAATDKRVLVMDEGAEPLAQLLTGLHHPEFPTPVGVYRSVQRPTFEGELAQRLPENRKIDKSRLQGLLESGPTWRIGVDWL